MIVRPVHNILLLPDVSYYFKKEFFNGWSTEPIKKDDDVLFMLLREEKNGSELTAGDFFPIGISAKVEGIDESENVQVRTMERVDISDIEIADSHITATASIRGEINDITDEEEGKLFSQLRNALLKFVQGYQWGVWARSYILQRKNLHDLACSLTDYLNLNAEEKYEILASDSRKERDSLIEKAIYEFIEISKVSQEATSAQKDDQEQLYREAAIKKQIEYLQRELDEMERLIRSRAKADFRPLVLKEDFRPAKEKEEYAAMVERAKEYIREGDIFQVVLSNPMTAEAEGSLFDTYRVLRTTNPSPYMFYFSSDDIEAAGASPETLAKMAGGRLFTFPLAGTRPRGKTKEEDQALEEGSIRRRLRRPLPQENWESSMG